MPHNEPPEIIDWNAEAAPHGSRFFGFAPALALGVLAGSSWIGGGGGYHHHHYGHNFCRPRGYYGYHDFYSCSPRFVCNPIPF